MSASPSRIFIVEDQRIIAADLENTLARLGYDVVGSVASGEEAIERTAATSPDLVLMDIRLRGDLDGIQAAEAIRDGYGIPVVYLTAYADEETILRARMTSPFGYLVKPFNERELRAAIEIALYKAETDRVLAAEKAGRRAAEELRLIVDSVRDYAIFRLDPEGRVTTWNLGAAGIKGYTSEEAIGMHVSAFYPAEAVAAGTPEANLRAAAEAGSFEEEGVRVRKDGAAFWASVVITALRDEKGRLLGFGKVVRDIDERRRHEDAQLFLDGATVALASSLDLTETLGRAARVAIPHLCDWCILDMADEHGRLAQIALAHRDPEKEALASRLGRVVPDGPGLEHGAAHVHRTGRAELHPVLDDLESAARLLGVPHPARLGSLGARSYLCVPIQSRGEGTGVLHLLRAGPRRRYGSADLALATELARRIGMAVDNATLLARAQEAIRLRDEFLQVASHELRTPLTPLQLQLDSLATAIDRSGPRDERIAARLSVARRQTLRLGRLVESLLDVSRISAGRLMLEPEACDLQQMLREIAERFEGEAAQAGSSIELDVDPGLSGWWDALRIEQVVVNLLSNAIKYGQGRPIRVSAQACDGGVRLRVIDQGIGIDEEAVGRIFGRFERAGSLRHFGGLGLGLYIARQIVEAHGGSITAASSPGGGAILTVLLPRSPVGPRLAPVSLADDLPD